MPSTSFRRRFEERLLDFVWSLWAEMGVAGWERRHRDVLIDPEVLLLFTAQVSDSDARLRDESTDWSIQFGRLISKVRLKNLMDDWRPDFADRFHAYAATVNFNNNRVVSWPTGDADPRKGYKPSRRSRLDVASRPALLALRLRCVVGVSARAEILRAFLMHPESTLGISELALSARYGKRIVADAVETLRQAGLLRREALGNSARYVVRVAQELSNLFGPLPAFEPRWTSLLETLFDLLEVVRDTEESPPIERVVRAERVLTIHRLDIARSGLPNPPLIRPGHEVWSEFEAWCLAVVTGLATGDSAAIRRGTAAPSVVLRR